MAAWLERIESTRAHLRGRGAQVGSQLGSTTSHLQSQVRARTGDAVSWLRAGTLDWRATLDAQATHARRGAASRRGLRLFPRRVVTQLDEFLLRVSEAIGPATASPADGTPADGTPATAGPTPTAATNVASEPIATSAAPAAPTSGPAPTSEPVSTPLDAGAPRAQDAATPSPLPIEDYDTLTAKAVISRLRELDADARARVNAYERAHKNRKTVLRASR